MNREYTLRIHITRAAARIALCAALLWLPLSMLDSASHDVTLSSFLPAPSIAFSTLRVAGKALIASNNGADVQISTTSCIPSGITSNFMTNDALTVANSHCRSAGDTRAAVRVLSHKNTPTDATVPPGPLVAESMNKPKLFVRGDISIQRLIWFRNNNPGGTPDLDITYWPDEITGFKAEQCANGYDVATGLCNYGAYDAAKAEVILTWIVKNGTGSTAGYFGAWIRRSANRNLTPVAGQLPLRVRSNLFPTTATGPVTDHSPVANAVTIRCTHTFSDPLADLRGRCTFKINQNVNATFPYMVDIRLMCVKIPDERWNAECLGQPVGTRHADCEMRCPANPETLTCPLPGGC